MVDHHRVREALTGPIASLRTPFTPDGEIDFDCLRRMVNAHIEAGSGASLLTAGDSHYSVLSGEEIEEVTRVVCEETAGRALAVAADRHYPTARAVAFAQRAAELGADVLMVMPPDWAASATIESFVEHYAAVAEHTPVMIVTNVFQRRGDAFGLAVLEKARDEVPGIVALKDDVCGEFARRAAALVHERWAVFSGGQKQNHLNMYPYGCDGYLSTFLCFRPEVAHTYWSAIETNDPEQASRVIREFDMPFFDLIGSMPGGFDAGLRGTLELFGAGTRWRRPPYHSLTDEEMGRLERGLAEIAIL